MAQQRERDLAALSAEVKAAYEQYDSAAEEAAGAKAAWKAAEGIVGAREVAELKGHYDALKEKEERRKERYEDLKETEKLRLQAELLGAGERSPLWACAWCQFVKLQSLHTFRVKHAAAWCHRHQGKTPGMILHCATAGATQISISVAGLLSCHPALLHMWSRLCLMSCCCHVVFLYVICFAAFYGADIRWWCLQKEAIYVCVTLMGACISVLCCLLSYLQLGTSGVGKLAVKMYATLQALQTQ